MLQNLLMFLHIKHLIFLSNFLLNILHFRITNSRKSQQLPQLIILYILFFQQRQIFQFIFSLSKNRISQSLNQNRKLIFYLHLSAHQCLLFQSFTLNLFFQKRNPRISQLFKFKFPFSVFKTINYHL